jgi:hypothetical protein
MAGQSRIDRKPIATVEATLSATAETLSRRMGGGVQGRHNQRFGNLGFSPDQRRGQLRTGNARLAEKYMLLLETIRSLAERGPAYPDGGPRVISTSPHVPVQLPGASRK